MIKLTLLEDDQLRKDIKNMIDAQFKSLMRNEVEKQVRKLAIAKIDTICTEEWCKSVVGNWVHQTWWAQNKIFLKAEAEKRLFVNALSTWSETIEEQIKNIDFNKAARVVMERKLDIATAERKERTGGNEQSS